MQTSITLMAAAAALTLTAAPGAGMADTQQGKHSGTGMHAKSSGPTTTPEFVKHAAQGGMAEVALGRLAADKATNPDVKQFGQRMVDDHSKANEELTSLASSKGIQPAASADPKHQALMDRLGKLSGAEFDKAYMEAMVQDHDHDVSAFRTYSERGADPEVKAWAAKTLPTLEEHQQLAKQTAAKVGAGTQTGTSSTIRGSDQAARSSNRRTTAQGRQGASDMGTDAEAPPR
jgi:putative membrane protein